MSTLQTQVTKVRHWTGILTLKVICYGYIAFKVTILIYPLDLHCQWIEEYYFIDFINSRYQSSILSRNSTFVVIRYEYIAFQCKIQKNWCTVTVAPQIEHHGGHSWIPANQRWDQVPGRSQRLQRLSFWLALLINRGKTLRPLYELKIQHLAIEQK